MFCTEVLLFIDPDNEILLCKLLIIFLPINSNMCLGAEGDRLIETVLLSTHTICFVLLFIDPDKEILFA